MKVSDKWFVTGNDGKTAVLRRETNEEVSESEVQRPDNISASEWKTRWPVGMEIGANEYIDRVRFEHARRKGAGVLTASEQRAVSRWNRTAGPIKQVEDCKEGVRVFLENFGTGSMLEWARLLYVKHSTRDGIAKEFAAISSSITLLNFLEKWEDPDEKPLDVVELEEARALGLVTTEQADEMRELLKDKEGQQ